MSMKKLTQLQQLFVDYYIETLSAAEAVRKAGYKTKYPNRIGSDLLKKNYIKLAIEERLQALASERIADQTEVLEYLTGVLRGESESEIVVMQGIGMGESVAKRIQKHPDEKERLKAAELLGKRYGIFTDKMQIDGTACVQIIDDVDEDADNEAN